MTLPPRPAAADPAALLIPSVILSSYAATVRAMGLDPIALIKRVGLDPLCLSQPDLQISAVRASEAIELAALEGHADDLGIRLALARGVPDIGPLNLLLREEPDLRGALRSLRSYLHLHSRSIRISLDEEGAFPILQGRLTPMTGMTQAPQSTEMILCGLFQTLRWLVGADWSPAAIYFSHPAPADTSSHRRIFGCPVEFGHAIDGIIFTAADMERQISHSPPMLRRHVEDYIRALEHGSQVDFAETVSGLIAAMLPSGRCTSSRVARHLGMDRTTLGRRLAASGQSYSSLLQDSRQHLAEKFCGWNWPLADVADQLGFSSISVFSRWFRSSYGMTPTEWRRQRRTTTA